MKQNAVYATVQPVPLPPLPSESMGVEGSGSGLGSEKMEGMAKNEVKKSIDVLEVGSLTWGFTKLRRC